MGKLTLAIQDFEANTRKILTTSFITHISRLGIPVINQTAEEISQDMETLDEWSKQG